MLLINMIKSATISFLSLCCIFVASYSFSQTTNEDSLYSVDQLFTVSLEELLSLKVESASKKVESSFETPLSVTVLTSEEITNSGATTLEEAFRLVPGMIVRQESNGNYDIHIRGLDNIPSSNFTFYSENTMTLVLLDGQKMYNHINGGTWWETFPIAIQDIDKIEIVRGPSTALYGPNAATGVINIITKKVTEQGVHAQINAESGTFNTNIGSISTSFKKDKLGVRVGVNYDLRDRFEELFYNYNSGDYVIADSIYDYTNGQKYSSSSLNEKWGDASFSKKKLGLRSTIHYDLTDSINFTLHVSNQNSEARSVFMDNTSTPYLTRVSSMTSVALNTEVNHFNINLSHQFGEQDVSKGNDTQRPFDVSISDLALEYNYSFKDKVLIQPGLSYQKVIYNDLPNIDTTSERGILNAKHQLVNAAFYLRSEYNPFKKLRFIAAIRADKYETPDTTYISWQLGSTYKIGSKSLLRYVYSKANRGPFVGDVFTNYTDRSAGEINFRGNSQIRLASIFQHELGFRSELTDKLSIDLELYRSISHDFSGLESTSFNFDPNTGAIESDFNYKNYDLEAIQLGSTVMISYKVSKNIGVKGFVSFQETRVRNIEIYDSSQPFFIPQSPEQEGGFHKNTPACYGGLIVDAKLNEKLFFNSNMYFYSSQLYQYRVDETEVPSNMLWNFVLKYNVLNNHVIFINARNAFNTNKREFGFVDRSKALFLGGLELRF